MGRSRGWEFTWNNYTDDDIKYINDLAYDYIIYGKEIGKEKNTPHLQGFIYFETAKTFNRMRKMMKNNHIEEARCYDALIKYSSKDGDIFERGSRPKQSKKIVEEPLDLIKPDRPWQLSIMELISTKADDRSIHWYWDPIGNSGKSTFTKYLCANENAITVSGKSGDCKFAIVSYYQRKKIYPKIVIFDTPRTNIDFLNYEAIESIKNGCFFSGKYESTQVIMNSPHVIIFANSPPQEYKLSQDRWKITKIPPL